MDRPVFQTRDAGAVAGRRLPVCALLECVRSAYNVGAFFRTGDAVGLEKLYLCGYTGRPPHNGISKTALGAERALPWEHRQDALALAAELRRAGRQIAIIETAPEAVELYEWSPRFPLCVVFGNEVEGVSAALAAQGDVHVRIPMLGVKESLNVAVAGGVVLFELLRKSRARERQEAVR